MNPLFEQLCMPVLVCLFSFLLLLGLFVYFWRGIGFYFVLVILFVCFLFVVFVFLFFFLGGGQIKQNTNIPLSRPNNRGIKIYLM